MSNHEKEAVDWLVFSGDLNPEGTPERAMHAIALGQAHATLALVEQQRIANLIAYAMKLSVKTDLTESVPTDISDFYSIVANIRTGLDLA